MRNTLTSAPLSGRFLHFFRVHSVNLHEDAAPSLPQVGPFSLSRTSSYGLKTRCSSPLEKSCAESIPHSFLRRLAEPTTRNYACGSLETGRSKYKLSSPGTGTLLRNLRVLPGRQCECLQKDTVLHHKLVLRTLQKRCQVASGNPTKETKRKNAKIYKG